jgi:hypothetical protein
MLLAIGFPTLTSSVIEGCGIVGQEDWLYTLLLTLQDATGEVKALVFSNDGTKFFGVSRAVFSL